MTRSRSKKRKVKKPEVVNKWAKQHGVYKLEETPKAGVRRYRRLDSTMLDKYLLKEQITNRQFDAGIKVYSLYRMSGGTRKITPSYNELRFPREDLSSRQAEAYSLLLKVFREIGKTFADCLFAVCCVDESASSWATSANINKRSGIEFLRLGLNAVADFFRLSGK